MKYGLYESHIGLPDKVHKRKVVDLGPMIVLDAERCVLCSRCIRFVDKVTGTRELRFRSRGNRTEISTFEGKPLENRYAGNLADLCPVGALTSRDFRFKCRVWFLEPTRSVCDLCSTGCSIRIDRSHGRIQRYVPRRNTAVNSSWICDEGRLSYQRVAASTRLETPLFREAGKLTAIPWEKALDLAARRIREARERPAEILAVATPAVTTEELYLFGRFARAVLGTQNLDYRVSTTCENPGELEDGILRRRDPFPSSRGAELLGLVPGAGGRGIADSAGRSYRLIYLLGADRLAEADRLPLIRELVERAGFVIAHAAHRTELIEHADLVLPVAMSAEKRGTFVNQGGRVQRIEPAVTPPGEAEPDGLVLAFVAEKLGEPLGKHDPAAVFAEMVERVPAFHGLRFGSLGDTGRQAAGIEPALPAVSQISVAPQPVG